MRGFMGALGAIGLGALIGAMVALAIDPTGTGLWVLGALTGGAIAYGAYDFWRTWHAVTFVFALPFKGVYWLGYGLYHGAIALTKALTSRVFWRIWGMALLACATVWMTGAVVGGIVYSLGMFDAGGGPVAVGATSLLIGWVPIVLAFQGYANPNDYEGQPVDFGKQLFAVAKYTNPVAVFVYLPYLFVRNVWRVIKLIHSDIRVVCFLYGSAGAAAGWFIGHGRIGETLIPLGSLSIALHAVAPLAGAAVGMLLAAVTHAVVPAPAPVPVKKD